MLFLNLHIHSVFSDGTLEPEEIFKRGISEGLELISITDHDTIDAWLNFVPAKTKTLKYITGLEINTNFHDNFHILGYGIDIDNKFLLGKLEEYRSRRTERIRRMVLLLQKENVRIDLADIKPKGKSIGRPHVADALTAKGLFKDRKSAFFAYLAPGRPAYVPSMGPSPREAIEVIKRAGGLAVLAHPGLVRNIVDIAKLKDMGLDGVEAFYPTHSHILVKELIDIARKLNLIITGGTDFHGPGSGRNEFYGYGIKKDFLGRLFERAL